MYVDKPDTLCQKTYDLAKGYYNWSIFSRFSVFMGGVVGIVFKDTYSVIPIIVVLFIATSEFFQWKSDTYKGVAESLRRKLDFRHSFGWDIPTKELKDIVLELPARIEREVAAAPEEIYFQSGSEVGPQKALENLEESASYSKHLNRCCYNYCLGIIGLALMASLVTLYASFNASLKQELVSPVSRLVTSWIMVVFSIGLVRTVIGYHRFNKKCSQVDALVSEKLKSIVKEADAVKLWTDYHIARASSPLIPTAVWNLHKDRINRVRNSGAK